MRTMLVLLWPLALQLFRPCKLPWAVSPPVLSSLHPPSPLIIITHPRSWYLFSYCHGWWNPELTQALQRGCTAVTKAVYRSGCLPQIDIIRAVVIVWRVRGKLSGLFCATIVCNNCAQCDAHTYEQTNSSLDWVLSHWAHFTVLRFIFACIMCITVYCVHV